MKAKYGWSVVPKGKNRGKVYKRDCPETTDQPVFPTRREAIDSKSEAKESRLVAIDGKAVTVISPRRFRSGKQGYYSQQHTVIDGKDATIQVLIYFNE